MLVRSLGLKISCKSDCYCYYVSVRYAERKTGKEERKKRKAKKSAPPEPLLSSCNIIFWSFIICYWKIKRQYGPKNYRIFVCFKRCAEYKWYLNLRVIKILKTNNLLENFASRDPNPCRKDSFPKIIVFSISVGPNPHAFILNCRLSYFKITGRLCNEATYAVG